MYYAINCCLFSYSFKVVSVVDILNLEHKKLETFLKSQKYYLYIYGMRKCNFKLFNVYFSKTLTTKTVANTIKIKHY